MTASTSGAGISPGADLLPSPVEHAAGGAHGELVRLRRQPLVGEQAVHRGQVAQPHREQV